MPVSKPFASVFPDGTWCGVSTDQAATTARIAALSPRDAKNVQYDFEQVSLQVSTLSPDSSRILLKPLAVEAGGSPHASKPFASRADTDYVAIRAWIASGVLR